MGRVVDVFTLRPERVWERGPRDDDHLRVISWGLVRR